MQICGVPRAQAVAGDFGWRYTINSGPAGHKVLLRHGKEVRGAGNPAPHRQRRVLEPAQPSTHLDKWLGLPVP